MEAVVEGVRTFGYYNAGQDCTAACRIYAQKRHLRYAGGKTRCCGGNVKIGFAG
ncbi:hypothetical protein DMH20_05820 [Escherichia coli]|nr:hypothetical protein [Escherichia coli]